MLNNTRAAYHGLIEQIAKLNNVSVDAVTSKFSVDPSVQQRLEDKIQESADFLKRINIFGVDEQEGEKIGLGIAGPIASTTNTAQSDRTTTDIHSLDKNGYRCEQTNYDHHLRYTTLDAWAKFPDFQVRVTNAIAHRIALDRMMIGFNGTSRAATSNKTTNPLLQDVNIGWLEKVRQNAPQRYLKETVEDSNKVTVSLSATGNDYKNLDAVVMDAIDNLLEPWFREDTELVVITGRKLLADKYFPIINNSNVATEQVAAGMLVSQKRLGDLPAVRVPYFPANSLMITRLDNLSLYFQSGAQRRSILDNPKRDRIETYQSSNDAFVIEDYGCVALIDNIEIVA